MSDLGNKEIFANNLKYYMNINNVDRIDICEKLNFKYSTFSDWVNAIKYPRIDKIELLANYFGIEKSDLIENPNTFKKDNETKNIAKIPIVGRVSAGVPILAEENREYDSDGKPVSLDLPIVFLKKFNPIQGDLSDLFALKIKGDSMFPRFLENDYVIVKKQETITTGQVAVILVNGDEATVKEIKLTDSGMMLIPYNSKYSPTFFTKEEIQQKPVKIIGRVVRLIGNIDGKLVY